MSRGNHSLRSLSLATGRRLLSCSEARLFVIIGSRQSVVKQKKVVIGAGGDTLL